MKILIVDDSPTMRSIVKVLLKRAAIDGADVLEAEDGARALALLGEERPDLVLSDWNMPQMSGIEFLEAARAAGSDTPIGFLTSEASPDVERRAAAAGASFVLRKPFTPPELQAALAPLLPPVDPDAAAGPSV